MKATRCLGRPDAFLEIDAGAALLVHDPELDRVTGQAEHLLDMIEGLACEGDLVGAVQLRLHDVDRAFDGIARPVGLAEVVHRDERGDHRIHQALEDLVAVPVAHRRVGHQMADIAHQHQGAALHVERATVRRGEDRIGVERAGHALAGLLEAFLEIALHQPEPVGIGQHLVLGIDAGDRILQIHDDGDGALQPDIGEARLIPASHPVRAIEDQLDMEGIVAQEHGVRRAGMATISDEFLRVDQRHVVHQQRALADMIPARIRVAGPFEREGIVEEHPRPRHDPGAPATVITAGGGKASHRVRAIEAVVETAPAGICRVEGEAGIGDRHDELRTRHRRDFRVDVLGFDDEIVAFREQVADFAQESLVGVAVVTPVPMLDVPGVDPSLQILARLQERRIARAEIVDELRHAFPEPIR